MVQFGGEDSHLVACSSHRVTVLAGSSPAKDKVDGGTERASGVPEVAQPALGRARSWFPGMGELSQASRRIKFGIVCVGPPSCQRNPLEVTAKDGCAKHKYPGGFVP